MIFISSSSTSFFPSSLFFFPHPLADSNNVDDSNFDDERKTERKRQRKEDRAYTPPSKPQLNTPPQPSRNLSVISLTNEQINKQAKQTSEETDRQASKQANRRKDKADMQR